MIAKKAFTYSKKMTRFVHMKTITSYLKFNGWVFALLSLLTVFPLGLILTYFPKSFPDIHHLLFAFLILLKLLFFREKDVKRSLKIKVPKKLQKELKRVPSHKEISLRIQLIQNGRDFSFILVTIFIYFTFAILNGF